MAGKYKRETIEKMVLEATGKELRDILIELHHNQQLIPKEIPTKINLMVGKEIMIPNRGRLIRGYLEDYGIGLRIYGKSKEGLETLSKKAKERWSDPELRERMTLDHKKLLEENPEYAKKLSKAVSKAMTKKWEDDEYRKEHSERVSNQMKSQWGTEEYKDKMFAKGRQRSSLELEVQVWLDKLGVSYSVDKFRKFKGYTALPDFLFKGKRVIEVQGDYWHANPSIYTDPSEYSYDQIKNVKRDYEKHEAYIQNGYTVLYLWESDIKNRPGWCVNEIKKFLNI